MQKQTEEAKIAEKKAVIKRLIERDQNIKHVWTHRSYTCRNCQH